MILRGIGALTVAYYSVRLMVVARQTLALWAMSYFSWDTRLKERFGEWAVVTGGTDGIGKQYALQLARRGLNVVLISRNQQKLENVAKEIESKYGVKTKIVVADFRDGPPVYAHIEQELRDVPVGILVNNVGVLHEPARFCDASLERLWELVDVNVRPALGLCRLLLPAMLRRGRGAVVNVSSAAGWQATPLMGVYSSTKAFLHSFTMLLQAEYAHSGVTFGLVYPMFVTTNLTAFSERLTRGDVFTPTAAAFAAQAVNAIGAYPLTAGYWSQALKMESLLLLPRWARVKIGHSILKGLHDEYKNKSPETEQQVLTADDCGVSQQQSNHYCD